MIFTKKNYNSTNVKTEEKRERDNKQFEIIDNRGQEPKSTKKEETETKKPDEIQKPLWIKLKNGFDSLTEKVYNNLNNDELKTTVDKKTYDLEISKKFLLEITAKTISENEACKLYNDLIKPDIDELKKTKSKSKDERNNILSILSNLESVFTGF